HEARTHGVAAVGMNGPTSCRLVPGGLLDGGVEEAALVEAEALGHALTVLEDLEPRGELHRGDVAHFLQQRQVAIALDVAGDGGIAIPVPRATDVAALLAEAYVGEACLHQAVPKQQRPETRANDQYLALILE